MGKPDGLRVDFAEKFGVLFRPARYKVLYGGRGGAKSWSIARALLLLALQKKLRVLCAREIQNSITDSVHKLLCDQIAALGLEPWFSVTRLGITCALTGSEFLFSGLCFNVREIKGGRRYLLGGGSAKRLGGIMERAHSYHPQARLGNTAFL